ncbi:unnamed protein product [Gulo gulo]|uniref:Uncharacterized protein n=1 Tax=Gulo gulo TaxID=48420 RepID=A0A9X9LN05_GULGU|nr:unnamed protein product [Gulo gulo]
MHLLSPCPSPAPSFPLPVWPGPWVSCPHAQQEPCPPPPLHSPVHDQSPVAVLMMNHSNLSDLKQKQGCYGFMGGPPHPLGFGRGGGVGYSLHSLRLALVAVLLASQSLPSLHSFLSYSPSSFPSPPLPVLHGNCTGLCVCVRVCACIYMYREMYMQGEGWRGGVRLGAGGQVTLPTPVYYLPLPCW